MWDELQARSLTATYFADALAFGRLSEIRFSTDKGASRAHHMKDLILLAQGPAFTPRSRLYCTLRGKG